MNDLILKLLQKIELARRQQKCRMLTITQQGWRGQDATMFQRTKCGVQHLVRPPLSIPQWAETNHFLLMGRTGSGKSSIIKQLLYQIEERGEVAIVLDPAGEFVRHFYRPERGDTIINPQDARMPYWAPGEELRHGLERFEALGIAEALLPSHNQNAFFVDGPRRLFADLIERNPPIDELIRILTDGPLLDSFVRTELQSIASVDAPDQRAGIRAVLAFVADTLSLLPTRSECDNVWSSTRWSDTRKGWVFLTSTPATRARCVPIHSVILDTAILRCMEKRANGQAPPTWFVMDEVQTLNRLPQLTTALTEGRKWNMRIVLGCQGISQLEARYGPKEAATILGQPATQIVLATTEPGSAEHASRMIGDQEVQHVTESRKNHWGWSWDNTTHSLQAPSRVPLVIPAEIQGLPNMRGYLKLQNWVVPFGIARPELPIVAPDFVPRVRQQQAPVPLILVAEDEVMIPCLE